VALEVAARERGAVHVHRRREQDVDAEGAGALAEERSDLFDERDVPCRGQAARARGDRRRVALVEGAAEADAVRAVRHHDRGEALLTPLAIAATRRVPFAW